MDLSESLTIRLDTFGTSLCSLFSLIGSFIVIFSYFFVSSSISSKPRGAKIILNLSIADCIWFSTSFIQSCFWLFSGSYGQPGKVPVSICYICSPLVSLSRISSLLWTCIIAFETIQSVKSRKWYTEVQQSKYYDNIYLIFVYFFSVPGALLAIIKQHTGSHSLGCSPGYERLGEWYEIVFTELIPIIGGFLFNIYAFFQVRSKLSSRAFPRSVRKRRKRVMYHYIVVCILCWCPTILFYILELCGIHRPLLEVVSRVSLYTTGFFNFLVFGMQDPHLSRSFRKALLFIGLGFLVGVSNETNFKRSAFEKTVMFENAEKTNADIAKDKKTVYRYHRLSKEERLNLYKIRPDLDLKSKSDSLLDEDHEPKHELAKEENITISQSNNNDDGYSSGGDNDSNNGDQIQTNNIKSIRNIDGKVIRKSNNNSDSNNNNNNNNNTLINENDVIQRTTSAGRSVFKIGSDEKITSPLQSTDESDSPRITFTSQSNTRKSPSDFPTNIQERIYSLSTGHIGHLSSDVERGLSSDEEKQSLLSERGQITLQQYSNDNRNLSEGDSIFNADHEDDVSSSEDEDEENDPNDIVGNILSWVF